MSDPSPSSTHFSFTLGSAQPAATHEARSRVREFFEFDDDDIAAEHLIAFSEVLQNAIDAHQRDEVSRPIDITLTADPATWSVTDHASGFDVNRAHAEPTRAATAVSGRGLLLARTFVPAMYIDSGASGTTVRIPVTGARWIGPVAG